MKLTNLCANIRARLMFEDGQTMAEYGVVLSVITIAIVLTIGALSGGITNLINTVTAIIP